MLKGAEIVRNAAFRVVGAALLCSCAGALGTTLMPSRADAQFFWDQPRVSPDDVARSVMARGFRPLRVPVRNDSVYVADVLDRRGRHERLIVSADSGAILQRFYLEDGQGFRRFADPTIPPGPIPPGRIPEGDNQPNVFSRLFGGQDAEPDRAAPQLAPDRPIPAPVQPRPRIKRVPRVVDRAPETVAPLTPVESAPLGPSATPASPPPAAAVAPPAPAPSTPATPAVTTLPPAGERPVRVIRMDPLALPAPKEPDKPAAVNASASAKPAKPAGKDVPVAPLD